MMFRSLAISSSLLALLASGSVMAMEPEGNERPLSPNPLKRRAAEEHQPEATPKKQKILSAKQMLRAYPLTPEGNKNLRKAARDGDEALQDEALGRFLEDDLLFTAEDYDLLLRGFCKWENMEEHLRKKQNNWTVLQRARQELGDKFRKGEKDERGGWLVTPDPLKAQALLEAAVQHNDTWAQGGLGAMLRKGVKDERGGWLIAPDPLKAKALLQACVDNDDTCSEAYYELGIMLWKGVKDERGGWLIEPDPLEAMELFKEAADNDYVGSWYRLGVMLRDGAKDGNGQEIIKRDALKAMKWLERAADEGYEKAELALQQVPQLRPAVPAAVQQNTFDVRNTWKFNPAELRNATEDELKLYDEILGKVEESSITPAEKVKAKNALLRFKTLHANNTAICAELMESPVVRNYSEKIYAVTPRDILIHPEQGDANLEQRAHIIHNILEATYAGVKENQTSLEKFFKEAFSDTIPCLEAQSRKIDDWRASQESIEIKISRQTIVQNIGEHANQLLEEMKKSSETGKKVIEATQDYQMLDMELLGALPEIRKASLKHTSQNIAQLEKKHEKWLKNNNKYGEMRQSLLATLVGKRAQDGEITENTLNDILSGLGWDFDPQE